MKCAMKDCGVEGPYRYYDSATGQEWYFCKEHRPLWLHPFLGVPAD